MSEFNIPEPQIIPYFDHGTNIGQTIRNSSSRRNMNPLKFTLRKIRNIILFRIGYMSPFNSQRVRCNRKRGVNIGSNVYIGQFCNIDNAYPEYVFIGDNVSIAGEVTILAHANPYPHFKGIVDSKVVPIVIKDGAWIGVKSALIAGASVGECSIVSAGSVVTSKMADYSMIIGNPAKVMYNFKDSFGDSK